MIVQHNTLIQTMILTGDRFLRKITPALNYVSSRSRRDNMQHHGKKQSKAKTKKKDVWFLLCQCDLQCGNKLHFTKYRIVLPIVWCFTLSKFPAPQKSQDYKSNPDRCYLAKKAVRVRALSTGASVVDNQKLILFTDLYVNKTLKSINYNVF